MNLLWNILVCSVVVVTTINGSQTSAAVLANTVKAKQTAFEQALQKENNARGAVSSCQRWLTIAKEPAMVANFTRQLNANEASVAFYTKQKNTALAELTAAQNTQAVFIAAQNAQKTKALAELAAAQKAQAESVAAQNAQKAASLAALAAGQKTQAQLAATQQKVLDLLQVKLEALSTKSNDGFAAVRGDLSEIKATLELLVALQTTSQLQ